VQQGVTEDLEQQARSAGRLDGVTPESSQRLLIAGVEMFSKVGFHATTTRDLAQRAGMSAAALYIHYRSKGELLGAIMIASHQRVIDELERALVTGDNPLDRFRALARAFVRWHAEHTAVGRIGVHDLGGVPEEQFREVRQLRRRIAELFERELRDGTERGLLVAEDVRYCAIAVISLGLDLTRWYSPARHLAPEALADLYADMAIRMVTLPAR
jgi:AcrR family transcriptional regulator